MPPPSPGPRPTSHPPPRPPPEARVGFGTPWARTSARRSSAIGRAPGAPG